MRSVAKKEGERKRRDASLTLRLWVALVLFGLRALSRAVGKEGSVSYWYTLYILVFPVAYEH